MKSSENGNDLLVFGVPKLDLPSIKCTMAVVNSRVLRLHAGLSYLGGS